MTKYSMVTLVKQRVSKGSATPPSQRGWARIPKIFGTLYVCTQYEKHQPNFAWWSN